jgi:hypothetical protein
MMERKKQTAEERQLGLDPEKYSKKPINPQDYRNYLPKVVGEMRSKVDDLVGSPMSDEEIDDILKEEALQKKRMMERYNQVLSKNLPEK